MKLEDAIMLACEAHKDQKDKGGAPYILHVLRVLLAVPDHIDYQIVAALHDVFEDTSIKLVNHEDRLTPAQVAALVAITKNKGEDYGDYIERVATDPIAGIVKLADLNDNMDLGRLGRKPTPYDRLRHDKYQIAMNRLKGTL